MKPIKTAKQVRVLLKQHSSFWPRQLELYPEDVPWLFESVPLEEERTLSRLGKVWRSMWWNSLSSAETYTVLRWIKRREMLRITVRDLADDARLEVTVAELSALADFCLQRALDCTLREMVAIHGRPKAQFAIFGLGKLGGQELNYSSDIDLIFVYSEEGSVGKLSHHEFFKQVAEKIVAGFRSKDTEGSLFRVDLRLRPEGSAGPITRSLESYENYYAAFGEVWERMSLQKARFVAGDPELGYEFVQRLQPFCFPKNLPPTALHEIYEIKCRIETEILKEGGLERHVKLGRGGIREIEFAVQALQLLHGSRNAFSQERSTLKSIQALHRLDLLNAHDAAALTRAYLFLRCLEHRLQMRENRQTHMVPEDRATQMALAHGLGFKSHSAFEVEWNMHIEFVRSFFHRIVCPTASGEVEKAGETRKGFLEEHWNEESLSLERGRFLRKVGFQDPGQAATILHTLARGPEYAHVSQRTRGLFQQLLPSLLKVTHQLAQPDFALQQFERFIEAYGSRASLYELLASHPKMLELLLKLFDRSPFLTDVIIHQPALLEAIAFGGLLTVSHHRQEMETLLARETAITVESRLRLFQRAELLRIALRDILDLTFSQEETFHEISKLADVCLAEAVRVVTTDFFSKSKTKKVASPFCVVALGKYGGEELSYGSDLDVIFVGGTVERAARLIALMGQEREEGIVFKIDTRLRPDGEDGPLTLPLEAYARYYEKRAQFWEQQALTRARVVAGDPQLGTSFLKLVHKMLYSKPMSVSQWKEMQAMRVRIQKERGDPTDPVRDFKTGVGGLVDIEFLVQTWQLRYGAKHPELRCTSTIDLLRALPGMESWKKKDSRELIKDYRWLRKLESILRLFHNIPVSQLPRARQEWEIPAKYLGLKNAAVLETELKRRRNRIRKLVERLGF